MQIHAFLLPASAWRFFHHASQQVQIIGISSHVSQHTGNGQTSGVGLGEDVTFLTMKLNAVDLCQANKFLTGKGQVWIKSIDEYGQKSTQRFLVEISQQASSEGLRRSRTGMPGANLKLITMLRINPVSQAVRYMFSQSLSPI